ncbi:MAG: glycosyltransferase [Bacteroidia bacterium]|nr:glycosyltransferase [Bacteroidia bacterium]
MELNKKKTILVLIDWYLPGRKAGGPVKSVESLVWFMKDHFNFKILTTDTDLGEKEPYVNLEAEKWIKREDESEVFYFKKNELSKEKICDVINSTDHDILYLNSYYSKWFSIVPLQLKKKEKIKSSIILAPRGMLSEGALALKKIKKKSFIHYSKFTGLHSGIIWHATYENEVEEIKKTYGRKAEVKLCPNFSKPLPVPGAIRKKNKGELRLFFLSRVSRVKNLHIALQSLVELNSEGKIIFDVFGSIEDENYRNECNTIIQRLPKNISVKFKGEVKNERVGEEVSTYHFLFLPTSNENFGHSIFEALQCGCPVIISNKTPWKDLEKLNCGWDVEPIPVNYLPILKKCMLMEDEEYQIMSSAALKLATEKLNASGQIDAALALFS